MSQPKQKLHGLDHLRAFAIVFVVLFHYQLPLFGHPLWLESIAKFGWTGVDLFFVLSGFLISAQLFTNIKNGKSISLSVFFLKRFFRILPLYWFVLMIYFCIPLFREREALPPLWKFVTFTQNFGLDIWRQGTFSHAWSLCVEEHFYFLLPVFLILLLHIKMFSKAYVFLIGLFIAGFAIRHFSWNHFYLPSANQENAGLFWYKYIYYPTYNRLDGLLSGISIAALYVFNPDVWNRFSKYGNVILTTGILILICTSSLIEDTHSYVGSVAEFSIVAVGYGLILFAAVSPTCILYKFKSRITTFIATLSYGTYLIHKGIIHLVQELLFRWHIDIKSNFTLIICLVASLSIAGLLYLGIEKPFMNWREKIIRQRSLIH